MRIALVQEDVTGQDADVVVNAANSFLLGGGGVDGAIHRRGGPRSSRSAGNRAPRTTAKGCRPAWPRRPRPGTSPPAGSTTPPWRAPDPRASPDLSRPALFREPGPGTGPGSAASAECYGSESAPATPAPAAGGVAEAVPAE
ncbi:hypothetical protein GCM10014719_01160 [Planomonospora parontospora subsp. antibiotica]|nr:hypothetical protein GCM10014719_01160 [Planomonospora parontospora subsp. antibiotica]GII13276.1 hypothetical protein Ppa05_00020 [Planomonospora parontospora subsp. antibiotica]